jgi:hypothetical protein
MAAEVIHEPIVRCSRAAPPNRIGLIPRPAVAIDGRIR